MLKIFIPILLFCGTSLCAQEEDFFDSGREEIALSEGVAKEKILCPVLQALALISDGSKIASRGQGVFFDGIELPGNHWSKDRLTRELAQICLSRPLTDAVIVDLKRAIASYYRRQNHPLVKIMVPEQDLAKGALHLIVLEARLGKVCVKGNEHTSAESIEKWVRVQPGETINESLLLHDVNWINTSPFRQVNIVYRPGEKMGTTDIDLVVSDRKKWRSYIGGDNTGSALIGRTRWFTGINLANIFATDHTLTFQFTTCNDFHQFKSYTFQYAAPLPWRHTISFFGAYAAVHPNQSPLRSNGKTYQATGRYTIPQWLNKNALVDQLSYEVGFDFKGTNNNIFFGEDNVNPIQQQLAWIGQFAGSFYLSLDRKPRKVAAGIEAYWSPGKMLAHQSLEDFATLRANATPKYFYTRLSWSWMENLPKGWSVDAQVRVQLANANLLASEQFALGGYSTVRGYDERVVNGDNAFCSNLEVRLPTFQVIGRWKRKVKDTLQFLGFFDAGYAWDHEQITGFPLSQTLLGAGPGLRYRIESYFSLRCDLGVPFHSVVNGNGNPRLHLSALVSY